jgi:hypothetical protein
VARYGSDLTACTTQRRKEKGKEESREGRKEETGVVVEAGDDGPTSPSRVFKVAPFSSRETSLI